MDVHPVKPAPTNPHRILIVDDEEIVMVALRETLRRSGFMVETASGPKLALELLKQHQFAAIISDHQMPEMTGLDFFVLVKQIQPDAARILITAVLSLDTVIDAINKGEIYRFIVKPWLREELLATVKNAVQRYELLCRNSVLQATTFAINEKLKTVNQQLQDQVTLASEQNKQLIQLNKSSARNLEQSIRLCLHTLQIFYPALGHQARNVQQSCGFLSEILNLPPDQRSVLDLSASLHDIGLIGVSRPLIEKWQTRPDSLTADERALIEQHPVAGQQMAGFIDDAGDTGLVIRAHHEHFDGSGYPDHFSGDRIPWLGRLLAVAVLFASPQAAPDPLETIKQFSGSRLDPEAVRAFLKVLPKMAGRPKKREILVAELQPGMVLAKGIYTSNGQLLVPEGQQLSSPFIEKLLNHHKINPINQLLVVYC
jgi:response regulator RpfG family c-di-GMP phosphodiesterase